MPSDQAIRARVAAAIDDQRSLSEVDAIMLLRGQSLPGWPLTAPGDRCLLLEGKRVTPAQALAYLRRKPAAVDVEDLVGGYVDTDALGVVHPGCGTGEKTRE